MLDYVFTGLFDSEFITVIHVTDFLLCLGLSLILGLVMAMAYLCRARCTQSFVVTLALLPAVVCIVIMLVNGNFWPWARGSSPEWAIWASRCCSLLLCVGCLSYITVWILVRGGMPLCIRP